MILEFTVQIERLEPMRVASVAITGDSPEEEAINTLLEWARPQGLLDGAFRIFGYDNCLPHPNHTYTTWLTLSTDVKPSGDITIKDFPGGLFAVTEIQGVQQISPHWNKLAQWGLEHKYQLGEQPGLEEHLDVLSDHPLHNRRFKLYLSIKE